MTRQKLFRLTAKEQFETRKIPPEANLLICDTSIRSRLLDEGRLLRRKISYEAERSPVVRMRIGFT